MTTIRIELEMDHPPRVMLSVVQSSIEETARPKETQEILSGGMLQIVAAQRLRSSHYAPLNPSEPAVIIGEIDRTMADAIKDVLLTVYPPDHPIRVLAPHAPSGPTTTTFPLSALARADVLPTPSILYLEPLPAGGSFSDLLEVMAHLRAPDGCPWDREQTHESLRPYILEETYEVLAALDQGDWQELSEELGDLLLQVAFQAQIAAETGKFNMTEVVRHIVTKLWRRHPHVFSDTIVAGVSDVLHNWEAIKAQERSRKESSQGPLSGIARGLPALAQAQTYLSRAERLGIHRPAALEQATQILSTIEETSEPETALGEALLVLTNWARQHGLDVESALRAANARLAAEVAA